ncbi:MAG: hypothetical protein MUF83_22285, partial [Acidimicrobiales bacterium]|nr:hypothetical protein [Acidimicrobiales bacterium]
MTPTGASTLITGISELVTNQPGHGHGDASPVGRVRDAAVVLAGGRVAWSGPASVAPAPEFAARMAGRPYAAGGIQATVTATREADDETLTATVARLAGELVRGGV